MKTSRNIWLAAALAALVLSMATVATAASSDWTVVSSPSPNRQNTLVAVSGISDSDVWALGSQFDASDKQTILAEHFDGTSWTVFPTPDPGTTDCAPSSQNSITGVYAAASNNVWAVGNRCTTTSTGGNYRTLVEHWDGTSWSVVPSPNKPGQIVGSLLSAVTGSSRNDVWAAGEWGQGDWPSNGGGPLMEHWDGTAWAMVPIQSPPTHQQYSNLTGISEVSPTDVWAVGYTERNSEPFWVPLIEHYDGTSWSIVSCPFAPSSDTNELLGVTAVSADDVWAVGYANENPEGQSGQGFIVHWDGTKWSLVNSPISAGFATELYGISATSSTDVWAVGYLSSLSDVTPVTEHWDGTQWTIVTPPDPGKAAELFGTAAVAGTVWAVGADSERAGDGLYLPQTLTMRR